MKTSGVAMTRRALFGVAWSSALLTPPLAGLCRAARAAETPAMDRGLIDGIVSAYDAQGIHRTGLPADQANAAWLAERAAALGASVAIEEFEIGRVEPLVAHVAIDGERIEGMPMFDAPFTGPDGVTGSLGAAGTAPVGLAELGPLAVYAPSFAKLRSTPGLRALVIVTKGGAPGLALMNAEEFLRPYGVPCLQVASSSGERLTAAAGSVVTMVADCRRVPTRARNVVATVAGTAAGTPPLVVMTPRSGWWQSTSERAGGLACWLAVLRAVAEARPARDVVLVASSGHELGHIGLDDFIARRPELVTTATWLHFGANIGARGGKMALQSPQDDLRDLTSSEMAAAGQPIDEMSPKKLVPFGEARAIQHAGGRYVTLVGSNALFHLPQDRWPDALDLDVLARSAAAFARVAVALSQ
jgi:hypothetical protein